MATINSKGYPLNGSYGPNFLKILAMAIHLEVINPVELQVFFTLGRSQREIADILLDRIEKEWHIRQQVKNNRN